MNTGDRTTNLVSALHLGRREMITFVGGATALPVMLELGRQVEHAERVVRLGTTTSVAASSVASLRHFVFDREVDGVLLGAHVDHFDRLMRLGWVEIVALTAELADGRPIAAPDDARPVIPRAATHVVAVLDADCLDGVIEDVAARPVRVAAIAGCRPHDRLTPERAAAVVLDERGGRKSVPPMARFSIVVTGVSDGDESVDRFIAAVREIEPGVTVVRVPVMSAIPAPERLAVT